MYPLDGAGVWTLSHFSLDIYFHIGGFAIENGFININSFDTRTVTLYPNATNAPITMPDLIVPEGADGLGEEVLEILKEVIPKELHLQDKHPVARAVIDYLSVIFSVNIRIKKLTLSLIVTQIFNFRKYLSPKSLALQCHLVVIDLVFQASHVFWAR